MDTYWEYKGSEGWWFHVHLMFAELHCTLTSTAFDTYTWQFIQFIDYWNLPPTTSYRKRRSKVVKILYEQNDTK